MEIEGIPDLEPRDYIYCLGLALDIDAQLCAIQDLLHYHRLADEARTAEIKQLEEHARQLTGFGNEWATDKWVDRIHGSVYEDAARSMAAVGMLAPFIETLFCECFRGVREQYFQSHDPKNEHLRWNSSRKERWDCHYVRDGQKWRKDLVNGILQLAAAMGLISRLPPDMKPTLSALFSYRNKMFHHGFEWPIDERRGFHQRIAYEGWPGGWFDQATTDGEPWIYCLSGTYIKHCLRMIDRVLDAFGEYIRDDLLATSPSGTPP